MSIRPYNPAKGRRMTWSEIVGGALATTIYGAAVWAGRTIVVALTLTLIFGVDFSDARTPERSTYGTCYSLRGKMANGDYVHFGAVASNRLRLGTHIKLTRRTFFGRRKFTVKDTGKALWDGHLDFWYPSTSACYDWGHRPVKYRVIR